MMKREVGSSSFPVWLIGDSNPVQWQSKLKDPLDPRHPSRHNIWTSVQDVIQDKVFRANRSRMDTSQLYIRNAVDNPAKKPRPTVREWEQVTQAEIDELRKLIARDKPSIIFCFGAFAFEFTRRAAGETDRQAFGYWGSRRIGEEFRRRVKAFSVDKVNVIPLLHRVVSGGKFMVSQENFCAKRDANYFECAGKGIADILVKNRDALKIWID